MSTTPSTTVERQAPTALLALVQHINDHSLGAPLSIHAPSPAAPYFSVTVLSDALDAWMLSGLVVHHSLTEPRDSRIAGRRWERIQLDGELQPYGLRVQLLSMRPMPDTDGSHLRLAEVPC